MKYIKIVVFLIGVSYSLVSAIRIDKLTADESQAAEADIDALMDKYDQKEQNDKDKKLTKKTSAPVDPN